MRTVYIFGAGASAAEGLRGAQFLRIAYRLFKEEQSEPGLKLFGSSWNIFTEAGQQLKLV